MNWSVFITLCVILSIPYGIGHWMLLQEKKKGTLISIGSFTSKYGFISSIILKGICYLIIIWFIFKYNWLILFVIPIMWVISGIIARRIERKLYAKDRLDMFEYHAEKYLEKFGEERAPVLWDEVVPKWWISMMSSKWQKEYIKKVGKYLKSTDVTNPLYDRDKTKSLMN